MSPDTAEGWLFAVVVVVVFAVVARVAAPAKRSTSGAKIERNISKGRLCQKRRLKP
jgi:hypothetical protein